jgi:CheY-like chemotaxis protein
MKIVVAEDDADDRVLADTAFRELRTPDELEFVNDGEELMQKLLRLLHTRQALPDLVVLDLNMPRKDGRTALREIKEHPVLRELDVVIFSTSNSDIDRSYTLELGARDYVVKPSEFRELVNFFRQICCRTV